MHKNLKVSISVGGKFHAFYLAKQLQDHNYLSQLITSYPVFEVEKSGISNDKVNSIIAKEIIARGYRKLPNFIKNKYNSQFYICNFYDRLAAKKLKESDIFVGWSSFSLHTLHKAKNFGALTVLERGSSHIQYQNDILMEEYEIHGIKTNPTHPQIVEKELEEYQIADYISTPSIFTKRSFVEKGFPPEKILHVPYGVDLKQFVKLPKEDNIFRVIHCGHVSIRKGCHYLLKSFFELNLPGAELWFVGNIEKEMTPFIEKYSHAKIRFFGALPQSELSWYYSQASVFVLFSIEEGLAMVQAQAMSCGLPVICSTNTGGEDLLEQGKSGFVVPIRDTYYLKEKILFLYENKNTCHDMGLYANMTIRSRFSWDDYGQNIIKQYKLILNEAKKDD